MKSTMYVSTAVLLATLTACSRPSTEPVSQPAAPKVPDVRGPVITAGDIPDGKTSVVRLSNGAEIVLQNVGGILVYRAEAALTQPAFENLKSQIASKPASEQNAILKKELAKIGAALKTVNGSILSEREDVGYFSMILPYQSDLFEPLKNLVLKHEVVINPISYERNIVEKIRAVTPSEDDLPRRSGASPDSSSLSGLQRVHAPEFLKLVAESVGEPVDGSSVRLGITDTGITYNHPTFLDSDLKTNRIRYMKDFTSEARVYFPAAGRFEIAVPTEGTEEDLDLTADVLLAPKLPAMPVADQTKTIEKMKIKVSKELREKLTTAGNGARLGVLLEEVLQADKEPVDINRNGKLDDKIYVLLVPGATLEQDRIYVDAGGTADFRKAAAMGDFNTTNDLLSVYAEKIGFAFGKTKVLAGAGKTETVELRSVSIVGYDPGNHGSHVAGIAAGLKTVSNDAQGTLARGVAPRAQILMDRVCSNNAGCNATEAIIDIVKNGKADVVNMSLGGLNAFNDGNGTQELVVNRLTSLYNAMFFISAGNSGPGHQTVGSPSTARLAVSVGASASKALIQRQYQWPGDGALTSDDDFMLFFSSRGPNAAGGFKPNLSAPGTELSSIQLNNAPGVHAGLDVYWGTSMAAPTATGAYALLLDGIRKFNKAHPDNPITEDVSILRRVLIETARPVSMNSLDTKTGAVSKGQYTWADQGTGIMDLVAAWNKLLAVRAEFPREPKYEIDGVQLDYQILSTLTNPSGEAYDGSRAGADKNPVFGQGLYLVAGTADTFQQVFIQRNLPEKLAASPEAGEWHRKLVTSQDRFALETTVYGSASKWIKVGGLGSLPCDTEGEELVVLGRGVDVAVEDGKGKLVPGEHSALNICLDRELMEKLAPGDHGALIRAYRIVEDRRASVASFIVPVYLTVPHKVLKDSTGYEAAGNVKSFGVNRHYVRVPQGASLVRVTLEVPELKTKQPCSGVELMALAGSNTDRVVEERAKARVSNCTANGAPEADPAKRKITVVRADPKAGIWNVHVFGQYRFVASEYKLKVDYVIAESSVKKIAGSLAALTGSFELLVKEASIDTSIDAAASTYALDGLVAATAVKVKQGEFLHVESPLGVRRSYPEGTKSVTITTGASTGNDIDLAVLKCPADKTGEEGCEEAGSSTGSTDVEKVTFKPEAGKVYLVRVDGFEIKDDGSFVSTETLERAVEAGGLETAGSAPRITIKHAFSAEQLEKSAILRHALFLDGKYNASGRITLKTKDQSVLSIVPLEVTK